MKSAAYLGNFPLFTLNDMIQTTITKPDHNRCLTPNTQL
jgi:hypothetical protein